MKKNSLGRSSGSGSRAEQEKRLAERAIQESNYRHPDLMTVGLPRDIARDPRPGDVAGGIRVWARNGNMVTLGGGHGKPRGRTIPVKQWFIECRVEGYVYQERGC